MANSSNLKFRLGTYYKVSFPTAPSITILPGDVELRQRIFEHDVLTLEYTRPNKLAFKLLKTGTPVKFEWYQGKLKQAWIGYVSFVSKESTGQQFQPMKIVCIGASFRLKARANRVWRNKTVTEVAKTIAKEFNFSFVGEASGRKFDQITMSGQSYFQFLQEQAKKIGYGFIVTNGTMYMRPLDKLINSSASNSPVMKLTQLGGPKHGMLLDRTLDSFNVLSGDYIEHDGAKNTAKAVNGVNPITGKSVSSTKRPNARSVPVRKNVSQPLFTDYTTEVAHSKYLSETAAGQAAEASRLTLPATAIGQGDPRLAPYKMVYIEGTGGGSDGYWMVDEVIHSLQIDGQYRVDLNLLTDGLGDSSPSPFRRTKPSRVGTINLQEAALLQSHNVPATRTRLINKNLSLGVEGNQGMASFPSLWSSR